MLLDEYHIDACVEFLCIRENVDANDDVVDDDGDDDVDRQEAVGIFEMLISIPKQRWKNTFDENESECE